MPLIRLTAIPVSVVAMLCRSASFSVGQTSAGAVVSFNVVDVFGKEIAYRVASFVNTGSGEELSSRFTGLRGDGIPAGTYRYRLERLGFPTGLNWRAGEIKVSAANVAKTVLADSTFAVVNDTIASISIGHPKNFYIVGRISPPPPSTKPVWIRLQSVYQDHHVDIAVDNSGAFRIDEAIDGMYVAHVISGGVILAVQLIRFDQGSSPGSRLEITLPGLPEPITVVPGSSHSR